MELRVNKCCCMSLRTGGLVFGWLGLVTAILNSIMICLTANLSEPKSAYASIAYNLLDAASSGIMIYGIIKNKHLRLLPWLIIKATTLVLMALISILLTVYALITADPNLILVGLFLTTLVGLGCWCWVVIFSLYKEIRDQPLIIYENSSLDNVPVLPNV